MGGVVLKKNAYYFYFITKIDKGGNGMFLSRFYKKIKVKDKYVIFHSLVRKFKFVAPDFIEKLETLNLTDAEIEEFAKINVLVASKEEDLNTLDVYRAYVKNKHTNIDLVYIFPTLLCNLKCDYCYIYNQKQNTVNSQTELNMNERIIDTFLNKYIKYLKDQEITEANLQFYGGEPLCNWSIVKYCITEAKEIFPFEFSIITNGTLLTEEMIDYFEKYDIGLGISLDGLKEVTDIHRKFKVGNASVYDTAFSNIRKLTQKKIRFALSVTVTEELLTHRTEVLDKLPKLNVNSINYNLLHTHVFEPNIYQYYSDATDFLIESHNKLHNFKISDDRISRKIRSFVESTFYYADCKAFSANQIVLWPNGDMSICQGELNKKRIHLGNIMTDAFEDIANNKKRLDVKNKLPIFNERCTDCPYISLCGGGCALQAKEIEEFCGIDKPFCLHTEKLFIWLLNRLYDVIY